MTNSTDPRNALPRPVDLTDIELTPELNRLAERIAENTHNVWMELRLRDGWRRGPNRDDRLRETPCLVPYGELPEGERAYDRAVAMQAVKMILHLGYDITPREDHPQGT